MNGFTVNEILVGQREMPHSNEPDLNTILPLVTGSLFADIEAKAAFWQRARQAPPAGSITTIHAPSTDATAEIAPMLQAFRLAYTNLREIWSLVLPPNTLLGLKRLYSTPDTVAFRMPDNLWARIVFDFLLAYRLRTINRGHLLGALIPLYLAWAASHINITASGTPAERHIDAVAAAFEIRKTLSRLALALARQVQSMTIPINSPLLSTRHLSLSCAGRIETQSRLNNPDSPGTSLAHRASVESRSESYANRPCHHAPDNDLSGPAAPDGRQCLHLAPHVGRAASVALSRALSLLIAILPGILAFFVALAVFTFIGDGSLRSAAARTDRGQIRRPHRSRSWQRRTGRPLTSPTALVARTTFWGCVLLGLIIGVSAFDTSFATAAALPISLLPYLTHAVGAILLLIAGTLIARFLARSVLIGAVNAQLQYARFLSLGVKWLVLVLTAAMVLDHLEIGGGVVRTGLWHPLRRHRPNARARRGPRLPRPRQPLAREPRGTHRRSQRGTPGARPRRINPPFLNELNDNATQKPKLATSPQATGDSKRRLI